MTHTHIHTLTHTHTHMRTHTRTHTHTHTHGATYYCNTDKELCQHIMWCTHKELYHTEMYGAIAF